MAPVLIFPYRTPSAAAIAEPEWRVNGGGIESVDLTGVDYHSTLDVSCAFDVDITELERTTRLKASELEFVLIARTESAGLYEVLARRRPDATALDLAGKLRASDVADVAKLQVQLLRTTAAPAGGERLVARHRYAVLWSRSERLTLAGVGSRLSVQVVDFSDDPTLRNVVWSVDLDRSDAHTSVSSAVQVRLNSRYPDLLPVLQSNDGQTRADRLVRHQLQLDVARQFVLAAREFEEDGDHEPAALPYDSVGAAALRCAEKVRTVGGLSTRADLWRLSTVEPAQFEMILQAAYLSPAMQSP